MSQSAQLTQQPDASSAAQSTPAAPRPGIPVRVCNFLCCEHGWRAKPLQKCCCCVYPIRKGTLSAAVFLLPLGLFLQFFFEGLADNLHQSRMLKAVYVAHCVFWILATLGAVVAFVAIKFNLECGPLKSAAGGMSKLMRLGFYLSFFTFFAIGFSTNQVCDEAMQPRSARMVADVCNCDAVEVTAKGVLCEPKTYHVCRFDRATHMQMVANARARTGRTGGRLTPEMEKAKEETCGKCGLAMDGDADGDGAFDDWDPLGDHKACTPFACEVLLGCKAYDYKCPRTKEAFVDRLLANAREDDGMSDDVREQLNKTRPYLFQPGGVFFTRWDIETLLLEEGLAECDYDEAGRLTSLNLTAAGVENKVDVLVDAGVLRMVTVAEKERKQLDQHGDENLQLMFPVLAPTITNDPNGTFDGAPPLAARSVTVHHGVDVAAVNGSAALSECEAASGQQCAVVASTCNMQALQAVTKAHKMEGQDCMVIVGGIEILFVMFVGIVCLHFAHVFFSQHITLKRARVADATVGGAPHSNIQLQTLNTDSVNDDSARP